MLRWRSVRYTTAWSRPLRCSCNILVETATARDPHHFAVLIGFGATAVYPFLAYEVLGDLIRTGEVLGDLYEVFKHYRKGISKGLMKIISKMGISTIASYRGAQLFEAVGLSDEVVELSFRGVASRIKGARFEDLEAEQKALAAEVWSSRKPIQQGGLLKFVYGGEYHAYNPTWSARCSSPCRAVTTAASRSTRRWLISARWRCCVTCSRSSWPISRWRWRRSSRWMPSSSASTLLVFPWAHCRRKPRGHRRGDEPHRGAFELR